MIENEKEFRCSQGHNQPVVTIAFDPQLKMDQRLLCVECVENLQIDGKIYGLKKIISQMEENQIKKFENVEKIIMIQIQQIESLQSVVDQIKQRVMQQLNELINIMMGWIKNLQQQGQQQYKYSFFKELELMILSQTKVDSTSQKLINEIQKINISSTQKLYSKLEYFKQFEEYNKCKELLSCFDIDWQLLKQIKNKLLSQSPQKNKNDEYILPYNDSCYAIAINKDCSELVAGSDSKINVFEYKQGLLTSIQTLQEHQNRVNILKFMKKSNQFISGSVDQFIIIWQKVQNNLWSLKNKLIGHSSIIYCLVLNNDEDLIISGSNDKSIRFWTKKNQWLCNQVITDHTNSVFGLSLNQQQNILVSCGDDGQLLIIEQSIQNKEWIVKQKIKVEQYGYRVCFIDNNMFIFSPFNSEKLFVYGSNQYFKKMKDIPVMCKTDGCCLFPQQYIDSKSILVSKNGEYVNFIKKNQNGDFITYNSIHFGTCTLFGTISDDGQLLITWDIKSKQIKIRVIQQ
ncbi:unnamed protein product [Paramecium primaurelia]|uniref:WD domain, G-beta repeat protein n=1 Tax=Paramecium primaurelia TaxID=5886 RepID=A0A8S1P1K1_PARPR|nr:unnamed protein product [Paramecium primaurelia]